MRHDGVEMLVDPGTYCYHGEPEWRSYFRSTRAHNTVEVDGENQAEEAGPFLWAEHADAVVDGADLSPGRRQVWSAHHTAYARLDAALCHDREVVLDGTVPRLTVTDTLTGSREHRQRMSWHLGPEVTVELADGVAELTWMGRSGELQHGAAEAAGRAGLVRAPRGVATHRSAGTRRGSARGWPRRPSSGRAASSAP